MAVGVTSMWMMYWIIYGKSAPWFVQNLHVALATRMPDALRFGVTLLLIAVAVTALGLLSVRIGYTILRSGNHVLSGTSKQKIGSIIYGAGRVVQIPIYLTALFAIALLGLTLSLSFLVMLFLNAAGAELTPLDGIESLWSDQDATVTQAAFQILAGVMAFVTVYVAGGLLASHGKRLNPQLDDREDRLHRTLSGHESVHDSGTTCPADQPNQ
jgi:hypothetical protein